MPSRLARRTWAKRPLSTHLQQLHGRSCECSPQFAKQALQTCQSQTIRIRNLSDAARCAPRIVIRAGTGRSALDVGRQSALAIVAAPANETRSEKQGRSGWLALGRGKE